MAVRVLHIAESFSAGVATAIEGYIDHSPAGYDHVVYGYRRPGIQVVDDYDSFTLHELPGEKLALARAVRKAIRLEDPDVVHLHSSWAGILGRLVMPRNVPVVFTPHCFSFERRDVNGAVRGTFRAAETLLASRTDVFATCSHHEMVTADRFPTVGAAPAVIHLPYVLPARARTQLEQLHADRAAHTPMVPVVVGSGRLGSQKGSDFFVEVVREAARRPAGTEFVFRWIGGGDEALADELRSVGVDVTGWIDQSDVLSQLAASDIYLHTAAWEGFPLTVLEAAAMRLPVVAREIAPLRAAKGLLLGAHPEEIVDHLVMVTKALHQGMARGVEETDLEEDPDEYAALLARIYDLARAHRLSPA